MFGYITVNKDTLSEENKKIYQSYYCGLCQTMKSQYGRRAQMALNYDMTFLIVLLTGLYEPDSVTRDGFVCSVHPTKKRTLRTNEITEYAAAMNILLAYYNLIDDWKDDKSLTKKTYAEMLKKDFEKAKKSGIHTCLDTSGITFHPENPAVMDMTTPSKPPSPTSRLLPFPRMQYGTSSLRHSRITSPSSRASAGLT